MAVTKKIVLRFPKRMVDRPIIYKLVKDFDLEFNILKASITPEQEGLMVLELKGTQEEYDRGVEFLLKGGVKIQSIGQDVTRNEDRCTQCCSCVTVCPSGVFILDKKTRMIKFDNTQCIACGLCIPACPSRAMELHF